ncbi:hypothetical protein ACFY1J_05430 [Streptomyces sp. NPDC001406]|uniref:hypothetical protein n=1 Tax=Streptomyces sp. NPDC001406 TaxID=3364572 RepID=UPI003674E2EE
MSDPAPCSSPCSAALDPAELISDGTCRTCVRYSRAILALLLVNLLVTVVFGVLGVVRDGSSAKSDPKPSPTATRTPSPSAPTPSGGSTSGGSTPTPTMPSDPTDGACNIFDPECPGTTGGSSGGSEA